MKYKGNEIGKPTLELINEYIEECHLSLSADEVLGYWSKKNFLTKKGLPVSTLESMVHVVNSIVVQRHRKGMTNISKNDKAEDWLNKNFGAFCECMNLIKEHNPQMWNELFNKIIILKS